MAEDTPDEEATPEISDDVLRRAATRIHASDGELEVDVDAEVSRGDDPGAYVQAWVWVYYSDVKPEDHTNG